MKPLMTFPHAGDYYLAFGHLLRRLGYDVIIAPKSSQRSLDLGAKLSPEQACIPFKLTLGNILEAVESGANVVGMVGGRTGMCRLAYYSVLYKKILTDHKVPVELFPIKLHPIMWFAAKRHLPNLKLSTFLLAIIEMLLKMRALELIRARYLWLHPCEVNAGDCNKLAKRLKAELEVPKTIREILKFTRSVAQAFDKIPVRENPDLITVGYIGEFFMVIDQFATHNIEEYFGTLGVRVIPTDAFSEWFMGSFKFRKWLDSHFPTFKHRLHKLAKPYINRVIGGHAVESVGQSIYYSKRGFDGMVHVFPFGCMPEIVATSILPTVSDAYDIPILSLSFDEQTGEAGIKTRIEAFVDMIKRKKTLGEVSSKLNAI